MEKIVNSTHQIVAVVTNPDKPQGRGRALAPTPVKQKALNLGLPVIEVENLADEGFFQKLCSIQADLFLVIAYRILPERVFTLPPKGTVNLHASLLPKYRGAAPIRWVLIQGEKKTGVTTFFIEKKVDTGRIILQKETEIEEAENYGRLHQRLSGLGAEAILETIELIASNKAVPRLQDNSSATPAPKITKEMCRIDWSKEAKSIVNLIKGLAPKPGAFTFWQGKALKILEARAEDPDSSSARPGEVTTADFKQRLKVQTGKGQLKIVSLQVEGKGIVAGPEFLRGYKLKTGEKLGV